MTVQLAKSYWSALCSQTPVLAWIILTFSFSLLGPYGTYDAMSLPARVGLAGMTVFAALAIGVAVRLAIQKMLPGTSFSQAVLIAALFVGVLLAALLPPALEQVGGLDPARIPGPVELVPLAVVLGAGIIALERILTRGVMAQHQDANAGDAPARLVQRLPDKVAGEVLHLSVDDHYVEVATDRGQARLLMRFSDAIEELDPDEGIRVHRSHWVARRAVRAVDRQNGRTFVVLTNGTRVPVSRAYQDAVAELKAS